MKNFILLALFAILSLGITTQVDAQVGAQPLLSTTNGTAIDTVINAGVRSQKIAVNGYQETVAIVTTVTKISGTVGGTIRCLGSLDNINWVFVDGVTATQTDVASQSVLWLITPSKFAYYQVTYTGVTGPMSAKLSTKVLARKP